MKYYFFILCILASAAITAYAQNGDGIQTIHICAIRAEFEQDDNELTTGDGKFMIDTVTTDPYAIDPAPHNRLYFQDQILAAANYFEKVSNGRVLITGDVFPVGENDAYQLPNPMGYYNPNTTDAEINKGIGRLFIDAIEKADEDEAINFSEYDLVVVFHAGVGRDIALDFDPTPQDISSLFVNLEFMKKWLGNDVRGAQADDGYVTQGVLLPETENQEGEMIALTGMFVSNIGTYLGLYDLFSPSQQRTGVGRFDLMDSGLLNLNGLAPSPPGAFSRKLLGWTEPRIFTQPANNIEIARFGAGSAEAPEIVQIPINDNEYYLLEYRGDYRVNIDSLFVEVLENSEEYPSYLEVLKTYFEDQIGIGESGVVISIPDYDWGLPGAGILIWHIDEKIIAEKGPQNAINDDPEYRAVDIEEADGSQDIGEIYTFLEPGYQTDQGWFADFWFSNRPEDLDDFELYENKFSTHTAPNTRANLNNALSYITLENFSANTSDVMSFDYIREIFENGYPLSLFEPGSKVRYSISGPVDASETDYLFVLSSKGDIYSLGTEENEPAGLFGGMFLVGNINMANENASLALADNNSIPGYDMLIAAFVNNIIGFSLDQTDITGNGLAGIIFNLELPESIAGPVISADNDIYIPCSGNKIYRVSYAGELIDSIDTDDSVGDLVIMPDDTVPAFQTDVTYAALASIESADRLSLITYDESENTFIIYDPQGEERTRFETVSDVTGQFILADLDGNNVLDIVFILKDGIYGYTVSGTPVTGFPIRPKFAVDDSLTGTPLAFDIDDNGVLDLICATKEGQVLAYSVKGEPVLDYQLSTGSSLSAPPTVLQLDDDGELELVAISNDGNVYAWQVMAPADDPQNLWIQANYSSGNNVLIEKFSEYAPVGNALMPPKKVFNYPNPSEGDFTTIRYYLNEPASVKIRIFDAAGMLVDEFSGPGNGQTENELAWNVSDIASGVYVCQVEAKSSSATEKRLIKIMVIH